MKLLTKNFSNNWSANGIILSNYDNYLTAVYKMENGALTTDSKGNNTLINNNGVLSNANGKSGYCGDFNGNDSGLSGEYSDLKPTSSMAVSLWYNSNGDTDEQYFFRDASNFFCEYYSTNQFLYSIWQSNNVQIYQVVTYGFTASTWYHICMIADGTYLKCYINGVQVGSKSYDGTISTDPGNLNIGFNHISTCAINGRMDEFYFYKNIAINPEDTNAFASALYNNGIGSFWNSSISTKLLYKGGGIIGRDFSGSVYPPIPYS